jgi:hypothetical protein
VRPPTPLERGAERVGTPLLATAVASALDRLRKSGRSAESILKDRHLLDERETALVAAAIYDVRVLADLAGRQKALRQVDIAREQALQARITRARKQSPWLLADDPEDELSEDAIWKMQPEKAIRYFEDLRPGRQLTKDWSTAHRRQAFEMAVTTDQTLLERVHGLIEDRLKSGKGYDFRFDQELDDLGVSSKNPQYCFLPGTMVEGAVIAASKANYDGPAVKIETASGRRLAVTVNHPVLTASGWKSAGSVQQDDELLAYGPAVESFDGGLAKRGAVHDQQMPARIEDVFQALLEKGAPGDHVQRPVTPLDFHGDAAFTDGQIDRVRANGMLQNVGDAERVERSRERSLMEGLDVAPVLAGHAGSILDLRRDRLPNAPLTAYEVVEHPGFFGGRPLRPPCAMHIGMAAHLDPSRFHASDKRPMGDVELYRQLVSSLPGLVSADRVTKVERIWWTGHVYNLQTRTGFIISQGIVTSNCEMVFRTNAMDSYTTGSYDAVAGDPEIADEFPYWEYLVVDDDRLSDEHRENLTKGVNGTQYYPRDVTFEEARGDRPFNCRCDLRWIHKYEAAELGLPVGNGNEET